MTEQEFADLKPGDVVRHANGSDGYIVHANYGNRNIIAILAIHLGNPHEWLLISKANRKDGEI